MTAHVYWQRFLHLRGRCGLRHTIGNGLAAALSNERDREPALITFLVAASGVTLLGIGSAFWGLIAGGLALLVLRAAPGAGH